MKKKRKTYVKDEIENSKIRKVFFNILILCVILFFVIFFLVSEQFDLKKIEVKGTLKLSKMDIVSKSEFKLEKNIFLQNYIKAKLNILNTGAVEKVDINLKLPDTIEINLKEREAKYQVITEKGIYIIDRLGYVIKKIDKTENLVNIKIDKINLENQKRIPEEYFYRIDDVNKIYEMAAYLNFDSMITSIDHVNDEILIILQNEGKIVHLKNTNDMRTKMSVLKKIIENEKGKKGDVFFRIDKPTYFREKIN